MPSLRLSLVFFSMLIGSQSWAEVTPIAVTSDSVPGLSSAQYASFGNAQMNAEGALVFTATLQSGPGDISSVNDRVLVSWDHTLDLKAQSGSGNVVGAADTNYLDFHDFKIADSGDILLKAKLSGTAVTGDNNHGFWKFSASGDSLIARTGTSPAPGVTSGIYASFGARVGVAHSGDFTFSGGIKTGGVISSHNETAVWHYAGATGTLVAREDTSAPGIPDGKFDAFGQPVANASSQIAFRANMKEAGSITLANRLGVWVYDNGVGEVIARANSAEVPGSTSDFTAFEDPLINDSGHVLIRGTLATGQKGLWLYSGTEGLNLAITNEVGIPNLPSASFASLSKPLLLRSGQAVAMGTLTTGVGGITASDDTGLWLFDSAGDDRLLIRESVSEVAGIPDASFASFERIAAIDDTAIYVNATLQSLPGVVDSTNDEGIWLMPLDGAPELILRRGDAIAGRTIADLSLPSGQYDEIPLTGITNPSGELLFQATFTNGDSGLFLYSPSTVTEFADADFDHDGDVDANDLAVWQGAYSGSPIGDTDADGDTDGADFLTWQRQYTGPAVSAASLAVPEPGVALLLGVAVFCALLNTRA